MARQAEEAVRPGGTSGRGPTSGVHVAVEPEKPLLASEELRAELAPEQPDRRMMRLWLAGVAVGLILVGLAFRLGLGPSELRGEASTLSFSGAAAVAAVAALPFGYNLRAGASLGLGILLMSLGFSAAGPLGGIAIDGGLLRDLSRLVVLVVLPAALLFRAQYRAYRTARVLLAIALTISLPFVGLETLLVADGHAPVVTRIAAGVNVAVVLCTSFGFMGSGTTGAGSLWAALVLGVLPAEIAFRELTPLAGPDTGHLLYPATAVGLVCAAVLASTGGYQLLAARLAPEARRQAEGATSGKRTNGKKPRPRLKSSKS